jgi:hypothetical protein
LSKSSDSVRENLATSLTISVVSEIFNFLAINNVILNDERKRPFPPSIATTWWKASVK